MNKVLTLLFCLFALSLQAQFKPLGAGSGGAPGVVTISPGANLATYNWQNDTAYQLGGGTYTVTPSILQSNLMTKTAFGGILIPAKTNMSIVGAAGLTVIDGRGGLGELLILSNCNNVRIEGIEFKGHTNFNWAVLPGFSPITTNAGAYLWASIAVMASCANITFDKIWVNGSANHGLWDYAGNSGALFPNANTPSTNNIQVLNSRFSYTGGFRTNSTTPTTALPATDGTAIDPQGGWTIDNCYFDNNLRGIEPYDEADSGGILSYGTRILNCEFRNTFEFAVGPAGNTNVHSVLIANCKIINDRSFNFRGTNYGGAGQDVSSFDNYGLYLNGGRGWHVVNTEVAGLWKAGVFVGNGNSFCDDFLFDNLLIRDIVSGGSGSGYGMEIGIGATDTSANASSVRRAMFSNIKIHNMELRGILIWACRDCVFDNIDLWNAGVYGTPSSGGTAAIRVGADGYTANNPTNVTLRDVRIWSGQNGASAQAYGIFFANNVYSSSLENWFLVGQAENGGITNKSGTRVSFLGPIKNYSGTVDYAAIAANTAIDTVFTAAGVTTNDEVRVSVPPTIYTGGIAGGELMFGAWATNSTLTDGQIVLRANNADTGAATGNPNNSTFHFQARQVRIHGQ